MSPRPTPTFGKRRPIAEPMPARSVREQPSLPLGFNEAPAEPEWSPAAVGQTLVVPNSIGAGVLTAAVIGVLHLVFGIHEMMSLSEHAGPAVVGDGQMDTVPLIILGSLYTAGRSAFSSAFIVHAVLRRLHRTAFADYALGGGLVALAYAGLLQYVGRGGPDQGWAVEIGTGLVAGLLYRLFAGAAPAR